MAYRIRQGRHFNVPKPGLDYTETFLYLLDHLGEEVRSESVLKLIVRPLRTDASFLCL